MSSDKNEEVVIPSLDIRETFIFPEDFDCIKLMVEWISKQNGLVSDLDLNMYCYDERARFIEKIDTYNKISKDESVFLVGKVDSGENSHVECLKFDFRLVKQSTTAILIYLDGGPRNFHFLQSVSIQCLKVMPERSYGDFLPNEDTTSGKNDPVFKIYGRTRKNYQGLALCALYKDGWNDASQTPRWVAKSFLEPMFVSSVKDKLEKCSQLVVNAVPALEKFRMRLFSHIKDICSALSSHALPKLKKKFQKNEEGLQIGQFTEVLFKQLYESHPRIIEEAEAGYTVAMLQEMFYQIDYNGDCSTNWDEFTTFCVQTGVTGLMGKNGGAYSLDQYVIEYSEAMLLRDHVLSAYRFIAQMRHVPETRKILVVPEDSDNILIFDEKLRLYAQLYPTKVQVISNISKGDINDSQMNGNVPRPMIYDVVYLMNRDMYAYASSDHSITIAKEFSSMGGKKINYMQYNRFFHSLLHLKLCWSAKNDILCSVASDRTIYGWNVDTANIIFQVSRHSDIITDFIAVDPLDIFITCSMDKRIVLWSATSRRVKGILLGHKRGVRSVNVYENLLLSAGFECEAKLWDITTKDCIAILKGHRNPIVAAKLICEKALSEKEHRAVTVDELGEFRLWNIYIRERSTDPQLVPTLQIFEMQGPENPINQFRFLALPYTPKYSTSYYSNIIACSTKLLQFIPEKNTKEFIPPGASVLSEAASCLVTAVGKSLLTYDISNGQFTSIFENVTSHDISALCMDGERGRRMYVGTGSGELLLVNSMNGSIIDSIHFHTKEITSLQQVQGHSRNCIFSASMDGSMRMYEESGGKLHTHNCVDNAFGEGIGVQAIKVALKLHTFIGVSVGRLWGIWHTVSFKKQLVIHMPEVITALEIIGSSRDKAEEEFKAASNMSPSELFRYEKENILTLAVAMVSKVCIYTFDVVDLRGIRSYELTHGFPMCINQLACIRSPDLSSMNYSSNRANSGNVKPGSHQLVGACDDGYVLVWDIELMRLESDARYRAHFKNIPLPARNVPHSKQIKHSNIQPIDHSFLPVHRQRHVERQIANGIQVDPNAALDEQSLASSVSTPNRLLNQSMKAASTKVTNSLPSTIAANAAKNAKKLKDTEDAKYKAAFLTELEHNHHGTHGHGHGGKDKAQASNSKKKKDEEGKDKHHRGKATKVVDTSNSWLELEARHMFVPVSGEKTTPQMMTTKCFNAHNDSIPILVPMNGNSCFTTVSHDGYHRVFNLEMEVLGELTLPNITDHMKSMSMCREPGTGWRFILERIPVTKHHIDIANTLVRSLKQTRQEKQLEHQLMNERRFNTLPVGFKGFSEASVTDSVVSQQAQLRQEMLKSLTEPPAPNLDAPPSRLPTKEEKELIRMSITMEKLTVGSVTSIGSRAVTPKSSAPPSGGSALGSLEIGEKGFSTINSTKTPPMSGKSSGRGKGLRASTLFGDSTVSMSGFGGPSLWSVPGEVDILSSVVKKDAKERTVPPAFSEASLSALHKEGSIDMEGIHMLRRISKDAEKIQVYDRCLPTLLVRNPSMSTSVSLPSLDAMRKTEIHFGAQKDMYKNAEKVINEKENLSKTQIRNAVAMARIELNVRKVNTMIHLIQPPSHDEVILPKNHSTTDQGNEELQKLRTEEQKMKIRLLKSASLVSAEARANMRPLDRESIDKWVSKMKNATEHFGDSRSRDDPKKRKREILSAAALNALEKQLQMAIRGEYRSKLAKVSKTNPSTPNPDEQQQQQALVAPTIAATEIKKALTTRALLPYYKLESVHQFMDIFAKVDENFSGDLDVNEWIKLFTSLNESIPVQEARMIFMKIDKDCDGYLTMRELVPVVFSKATREQQRLIIAYAEMELTKKVEHENIPKITHTELEQLFEAYDSDNIGFVDVAFIKDKIRGMNLSEQALFYFMESVVDLADDEMVNLAEFKRLFKSYTAAK